jgi:hypothetical protein
MLAIVSAEMLFTPHSAAYTMETQQEKMLEALAAYSDYGNDLGVVHT